MVNSHQKKGKGKLRLFCGNVERVIPIYGHQWCDCSMVCSQYCFPKDHAIYPALDYIRIDEELVARCPMILSSYAGLRGEATADGIHVRDRTAVYCKDNNIFL